MPDMIQFVLSSRFHISQNDETNNVTSDDETSSKRSVRFNEESGDVENQTEGVALDEDGKPKSENQLTDYVTHMSLKRHSSLFNNALRRKRENFLKFLLLRCYKKFFIFFFVRQQIQQFASFSPQNRLHRL